MEKSLNRRERRIKTANAKKRGKTGHHNAYSEILLNEIGLDYETTILSEGQREFILEETKAGRGGVARDLANLFAYSVQISLVYKREYYKLEKEGDKEIYGNEIEKVEYVHKAHIFLDSRIRMCEDVDCDELGIELHAVSGDCVKHAVDWLTSFFWEKGKQKRNRSKTDKKHKKIVIRANAFNVGFEESYSVATLLNTGWDSTEIMPRGFGGVMISKFAKTIETDYEEYATFELVLCEASAHWRANSRLSDVFKIYGMDGKNETPLFIWTGEKFVKENGEEAKIDNAFLSYAKRDVCDLMKCLELKRKENGEGKTMTASSTTKLKHKQAFIEKMGAGGDLVYDYWFRGATADFDKWIRGYTYGGYNFVNRERQGEYQRQGENYEFFLGIDRTNAYLSVMCEGDYPIGDGIKYYGKYEEDDKNPFFYQRIYVSEAILKPRKMPFLQWKRQTDGAEAVYGIGFLTPLQDRFFILDKHEIKLMKDCYDIRFEYCDGYKFAVKPAMEMFGFYLKPLFDRRRLLKEEMAQLKRENKRAVIQNFEYEMSKREQEADRLKLWGNGLYGKFFENPNKKLGKWEIFSNGEIDDFFEDTIMENPSPSYIGAEILRRQRCALIEACNKVLAAGGEIFQCDTDAFLCGVNKAMLKRYPILDFPVEIAAENLCIIAGIEYGDDLGQWHKEKFAVEGITVDKKVYLWSKKVLGLTERGQYIKLLGEKNFYAGTRGVKKKDALEQLTPASWRQGTEIKTTQFARLGQKRKGQIYVIKKLAEVDEVDENDVENQGDDEDETETETV